MAGKEWLPAPESILPALQDYVARHWVFVATKAHRDRGDIGTVALHPLAFRFETETPVYPLMLTGVGNGTCAIDLFVFGEKRAAARHFTAVRCDRVANQNLASPQHAFSRLKIPSSEVGECIGTASVGTKLSGKLTSRQMKADVEIGWRPFFAKGARVYSRAAAGMFTLNVMLPVAAVGWVFVGATDNGWKRDDQFILRWRQRMLGGVLLLGLLMYWWLPKVEIIVD